MKEREPDARAPSERVDDLDRIVEAMRSAVRAALRRHKLLGNPVVIWRNDRVEWIAPEDIPVANDTTQG